MGKEVQARTVLWFATFLGCAVNYMLRINVNISIVDMIKASSTPSGPSPANITKCHATNYDSPRSSFVFSDNLEVTVIGNTSEMDQQSTNEIFIPERFLLRALGIPFAEQGFEWNEHEQNALLGSYYWLYFLTQIPGGVLSRKYGTKIVFGLSNFIGCTLCLFMPIAAYLSFKWLIALRVIQGIVVGAAWPAMHTMTGRWIPPNERSKFVTSYMGSSMGVALSFPLFGLIISWTSWEWVFHASATLGLLWFLFWCYFVYETPAEHPRISIEERRYIEVSLKSVVQKKSEPIPWKDILLSRPVWITITAQMGSIWGLFTLMTQALTYLKLIHDLPVEWTGLLSGIPHLMRFTFALGFSILGDRLLQREKISRTNLRKLAGFLCCFVNGIFILCLAYSGCNKYLAIAFLILGTMVHGAVSSGPLSNIVDSSPNFAGVLLGLSGTVTVLPGFLSPVIVGYLTNNNQSPEQWKIVFQIAASLLILSGSLYVAFADASLQPWNSSKKSLEDKVVMDDTCKSPKVLCKY